MRERITRPDQIRHVEGEIPGEWIYTAGIAGEEFLKALRDKGVFLGARCGSCDVTYVPPRTYCEQCFARLKADRKVGPGGEIQAMTTAHIGMEDEPLREPVVWVAVKLDGADTVLVHRLGEHRGKARIGTKVKPVFKPKNKRAGSVNDIMFFKPE